jgi:Neprosin
MKRSTNHEKSSPTLAQPAVVAGGPRLLEEIASYFEARHKRLSIVKTTRTPSGQIIDWVPLKSQVSDGKIASPPRLPKSREKTPDPRWLPARFELENTTVDRGPPGTVPILRRKFDPTKRFDEVLNKRRVVERLLIPRKDSPLPGHDYAPPNLFGFYHTTSAENTTCYGCETILNVYDPFCELDSDHSISQIGLKNYDNPALQSLEAGWTVDRSLNKSDLPHVFTYYTTNGYAKNGDSLGGYNSEYAGWVQVSPTIFPGAAIVDVSAPWIPLVELSLRCFLYLGNWWLSVGGSVMGYYPANLFVGGAPPNSGTTLADHADWCAFWGEVYSARQNPSQTITCMGSGQHAKYGFCISCYQRNTKIQTDRAGNLRDSKGASSVEDANMYDMQLFNESGDDWGSYFYFGGSGVGAPHISVQSPFP